MCAIIVPTQRLDDSAKTSIKGGDQKSKQRLHDPTQTAGDTEGEKQPKAHNNQPHQPTAAPTNSRTTHNNRNNAHPQILPCVFDERIEKR